MADTTWIQVADSAVKIGLGGLVGGFFSWLVARHNSKSQIQKLAFERRSKMLTEVAETMEQFVQGLLKLNTHLVSLATVETQTQEGKAFAAERYKEVMQMRLDLLQRAADALAAQSKLMLLGEPECEKSLETIYALISKTQHSYDFQGTSFKLTGWEENIVAVREARKAFFGHMEKAFRKS